MQINMDFGKVFESLNAVFIENNKNSKEKTDKL